MTMDAQQFGFASNKGVRTQHKDFADMKPQWKKCRDVLAGQRAVHKAGVSYLPMLKEQAKEDYDAYLSRADFYNASWRTVDGLTGMMFRKPPVCEVPDSIKKYMDDINLSGTPLDRFVKDVAVEVFSTGRVGLLVDFPIKTGEMAPLTTLAVAEKTNLRPIIQKFKAETIVNWRITKIDNKYIISRVVLEETHTEDDGEFGTKEKTLYRVLDLTPDTWQYRIRLFEPKEQGTDILLETIFPLMNGNPVFGYIPFFFLGVDGVKPDVEEPPLIDLIDKNISHYRTTADYEHGCHFTGLPTPWISGYTPAKDAKGNVVEKLYIGSQSAWIFPDPGAKAEYLEFSGQGLEALRKNLDAKKQEMATLGARMLTDASESQVETYGATAIKHNSENSILSDIAISISTGVTMALQVFAKWANAAGECKYEINRDFFPFPMDAPTLTALLGAWQQGGISEPELFTLLQRGDLIDAEKTLEDHQNEVEEHTPPAPPSTAEPGRLGKLTPEEQATKDAEAAKKLADAVPPKKAA